MKCGVRVNFFERVCKLSGKQMDIGEIRDE